MLFALGILLGTPPTKDIRCFPGKTAQRFDPGQVTGHLQMLLEVVEIDAERLLRDLGYRVRPEDVRNTSGLLLPLQACPAEYVRKVRVVWIEFGHGSASQTQRYS